MLAHGPKPSEKTIADQSSKQAKLLRRLTIPQKVTSLKFPMH